VDGDERYGIAELAELGGVSRRTVRYYVQEGLLPAPLGVGRGRHYGAEHLRRLLAVKALQERGHTLDEVREALDERQRPRDAARDLAPAAAPSLPEALRRSPWTRVELLPGVELHVSGRRLPPAGRLEQLAEWCRQHLRPEGERTE
jgi:DNA-binding transcriptional MerR regulator